MRVLVSCTKIVTTVTLMFSMYQFRLHLTFVHVQKHVAFNGHPIYYSPRCWQERLVYAFLDPSGQRSDENEIRILVTIIVSHS